MSSKAPMEVQALYDVMHKVRPGSRLKVVFDEIITHDMHRLQALINLLGVCAPDGNAAEIENNRRPDMEAAAESQRWNGSRTFFIRVRDGFERYGELHNAISTGLIARMSKV